VAGIAGGVDSAGGGDPGAVSRASQEIPVLSYYLELAIRSLRRNVALTTLMVLAIGVGIGVCMTAFTTLHAMARDPIPDKSSQLFVPHIDAWNPERGRPGIADSQFSYRDAMALMQAHRGERQAAMYQVALNVAIPSGRLVQVPGRATFADFFSMFEVPFRSGGPWSQQEDEDRANVVVLGSRLADRLFPHREAVGQTLRFSARDYRVVGVIRPWTPTPRFYDLLQAFGETEDFYLPFSTAIDRQMTPQGYTSCTEDDRLPPEWGDRLTSGCFWVQLWVELPTAAQQRDFGAFLVGYANEQRRLGLYHWAPRVHLLNLMDWLTFSYVVSDAVRVNTLIATGLLIVCLVNAVGLMLAKFASRAAELGVRRALGASRWDLFLQCFAENLIVGLLSGALGLALTVAGLWGVRALRNVSSPDSATGHLYCLDARMILIILAGAISTTVLTGLYPTLRAVRVQPAWQLKVQ
jgi:putative ABC transport system permease protein